MLNRSAMRQWLAACVLLAAFATPAPGDAQCASDLDADGICDPADNDRDGDGVANARDPRPNEKDVAPPVVTYEGASERTVTTPTIVIAGRALDPGTGIAPPMKLRSSRLQGQELIACPDLDGDFTFEPLPLVRGENRLTIETTDRAGRVQIDTIEVTYVPPPIAISIASPADGHRVQAQSIAVSGTVLCDATADRVRVSIGTQSQAAQALGNGSYSFAFSAIPLQAGLNRIVVNATTRYDTRSAAVDVHNEAAAPPAEDVAPPSLHVLSPSTEKPLREGSVTLVGIARDDSGIASVEVAGQPALLFGADAREQRFERWLDLSGEPDGPLTIVVRAFDRAGRSTEKQVQLSRDAQGPSIEIESPALTAPIVHTTGNPLTVRGVVSDGSLAGVEVDGRGVALTGLPDGRFRFETEVGLPPAQDQEVVVRAWDSAGSTTQVSFVARLDAQAHLAVIEPVEDASLLVPEDAPRLSVVAMARDLIEGAVVLAELGGRSVAMTRDGPGLTASLDAGGLSGLQELRLTATHEGSTLATATRRFRLTGAGNVPLEVLRFDPDNGSAGIETNSSITVRLSKPVQPGSLTFDVRETVHGFAYDAAQPGRKVPVNRDQLKMPGAVTVLPDGLSATFYPQREFGYGGHVQVSVAHGAEEIGRSMFALRALPTLVQGGVADQFGEPVAGVIVELPSRKLRTTTNADGAYEFGFGDAQDAIVAPGRQRLVINPGMSNPRFGSREIWIAVEDAALNRIERTSVPLLNPQVPFVHLASGQGRTEFAAGGLVLDLAQAQLLFPGLQREGAVHVQFADHAQLGVESTPSATPLWAFAVQPQGIEVNGPVEIEIAPPLLYGSRSYLPPEGQLVLLVGLDREHRVLEPAGVARMASGRLVSTGAVRLELLDYVGVRLVEPQAQALLQQYASGQVGLAQLTRALAQ